MSDSMDSWIGKTVIREVAISTELIDAFTELSGDRSPVHCNAEFARAIGFRDRIAHGALLIALTSALVGNELPGRRGVLQSLKLDFRKPNYPGDRVIISMEVVETHSSTGVLVMNVRMTNQRNELVCTGTIQVGLVTRDVAEG